MKISALPIGKILAAFLSGMLFLNGVHAAEAKQAAIQSTPLIQSYVWYDGDRERQVWLNPQVVAEFNPSVQGENSVKNINPAATILRRQRSQAVIRLWQINTAAETAIQNLQTTYPQGKYSAVLHDGPSSGSRMRSLPGNIIVYLDPQWNTAEVNAWLNVHKLKAVKKLEIGQNIYVIKTRPGLAALETANALYRSGEVKAAFPDWWQEVVPR